MDFDNLSNDDDFHSSFNNSSLNATFLRQQQQAAAFNKVDPEVASLMSSLSATATSPTQLASSNNNRPYNSSYAGSEAESDRLSNPFSGLNKDSLSVISAPYLNRGPIKHNLFGSASIAGHVITQASPFDNNGSQRQSTQAGKGSSNFLEKFGSVADRTRDLENGMAHFSLDDSQVPSERRASFLSNDPLQSSSAAAAASQAAQQAQAQPAQQAYLASSSSPNSLHEALNASSSRHQSVSDRIDSYQQEQERRISFSSDAVGSDAASATTDHAQQIKHNIWNPASAHTFQPAGSPFASQQAQQPQQQFFFGGNPPVPIFPNMYMPFAYQQQLQQPQGSPSQLPAAAAAPQQQPFSVPQAGSPPKDDLNKDSPENAKIPGVNNFLRRSMSPPAFAMPPFIPYGMFPAMQFPGTPPPPGVQAQQQPDTANVAVDNGATANNSFQPSFNSRDTPSPSSKFNSKKSPHIKPQQQQAAQAATSSKNGRSRNGPPFIQRSPLLEEFRSNSSGKEYKLGDIYGHGIEFSKDQHGSRFIQAQLSKSTEEEKEVIFNEIRDFGYELMSDVFGNYVIQKYFEFGNEVQRKVLLDTMESHIKELSLQMYGCRVVQRAIEHIQLPQKLKLVSELDDANIILECCKDANGNHVVQKAIEIIPTVDIRFIFESIKDQIYHLSTNSFGCRVVQKLLEFGEVEQCEFIVNVLEKYVDVLLIDKFGNYVIQYILTSESNCDTTKIIDIINSTIQNDFTKLSANKFSSNVVESFITTTPLESRLIIKKQTMEDDNSKLFQLINDPYGNYVIQKLVTVDINGKDDITKQFVTSIKDYLKGTGNTNSKASIEKLRNIINSI